MTNSIYLTLPANCVGTNCSSSGAPLHSLGCRGGGTQLGGGSGGGIGIIVCGTTASSEARTSRFESSSLTDAFDLK